MAECQDTVWYHLPSTLLKACIDVNLVTSDIWGTDTCIFCLSLCLSASIFSRYANMSCSASILKCCCLPIYKFRLYHKLTTVSFTVVFEETKCSENNIITQFSLVRLGTNAALSPTTRILQVCKPHVVLLHTMFNLKNQMIKFTLSNRCHQNVSCYLMYLLNGIGTNIFTNFPSLDLNINDWFYDKNKII